MRAKRSGQAAKIRRRRWGVVALVLAGLALCLLAALPVQAARNTKSTVFRWILRCGASRMSMARGQTLYRQSCVSSGARHRLCGGYSGAGSTGRGSDCGGIQPAMATICASCTRMAARPATRTCNTSMSARERWYRPGRRWAQWGRQGAPPVRTCIWNCGSRALPATPPLCWRMPLEPGAGGEAGIPGSGTAVRRGVPAALL